MNAKTALALLCAALGAGACDASGDDDGLEREDDMGVAVAVLSSNAKKADVVSGRLIPSCPGGAKGCVGGGADDLQIGGRSFPGGAPVPVDSLPQGMTLAVKQLKSNGGSELIGAVYNQEYSSVRSALKAQRLSWDEFGLHFDVGQGDQAMLRGELTPPGRVDRENKAKTSARYVGKAYGAVADRQAGGTRLASGDLDYRIDFGRLRGSGQITGLPEIGPVKVDRNLRPLRDGELPMRRDGIAAIQLMPTDLAYGPSKTGAGRGAVQASGSVTLLKRNGTAEADAPYFYHLELFGPRADEIAGYVSGYCKTEGCANYGRYIGFGGARR